MDFRVSIETFHIPARPWRRLTGLWAAYQDWHMLRRSRCALLRLDDAHLRDIGLTRSSAVVEARRSLLVVDSDVR